MAYVAISPHSGKEAMELVHHSCPFSNIVVLSR
jgi:hypothetical protein